MIKNFENIGKTPFLGVVIVTYNSADVILDCLESLLNCSEVYLQIVIVDNDSNDGTPERIRSWASGEVPFLPSPDLPIEVEPTPKPLPLYCMNVTSGYEENMANLPANTVTLLTTGVNSGFAAGVNYGLAYLARMPCLDRFWILNPDCIVMQQTPSLFANASAPDGTNKFALMSGRILYLDGRNDLIQCDGGTLRRTGVAASYNKFLLNSETPEPDPSCLAFLSGASLVVSRQHYERVGPMPEDYFLYYEEVEWALRREALPLAWAEGAAVWHRAGTSIGSGRPNCAPSEFSLYFLHRARLRFVRRFFPWNLPIALALSVYKACELLFQGNLSAARTIIRGSLGMTPPATVRNQLSDHAQRVAFGG